MTAGGWLGEREFSSDDIDHRDEVFDGPKATCSGFGGLDEAVDAFEN